MHVATKADVENHFNTHGTGEITEIKLMNGFGFIEYKDAMDARDVVPGKSPPQHFIMHMNCFVPLLDAHVALKRYARSTDTACSLPYVNPTRRLSVPNLVGHQHITLPHYLSCYALVH